MDYSVLSLCPESRTSLCHWVSVVYSSILSIVYSDPVSDDHMLGLGLEKCLPRIKHISDIKQLVSLNRIIPTLSYYPDGCNLCRVLVLYPCVIIISICLKWYFRLDITSNTLQFSIHPEEAYKEPIKAPNDQNQSVLIVASISDASLKLRPNTPTLIRIPIDT